MEELGIPTIKIEEGPLLSVTLSRFRQEKQHKMGALIHKPLDKGLIDAPTLDDPRLDHLPDRHRQRVCNTFSLFSSMRDGNLGEINPVEHRIDLIPDTKPIYAHFYRAEPL